MSATRRGVIVGATGLLAAVAAGLYRFTDLFVKHYPPTPYDDLLAQVVDREQAAILGRQVAGDFDVPREAAGLRTRLAGSTLLSAAESDIATGRLAEVDGWLVPQVVARLSALAARA
jgi:hypothetical protein